EDPPAADDLRIFTNTVLNLDLSTLEELYGGTFEVQAITTLDISYVLFGDDYKRGQMLSNLNREQEKAGVDLGSELPDHLPNVLRLLPRLKDDFLREDLIRMAVIPALDNIIQDFGEDRMKMKREMYKKHHKALLERPDEYNTIYKYPIMCLLNMMKRDMGVQEPDEPIDKSKGFLNNLDHEIKTEHSKS
ncbi:MAG: hypothetical protein ABEH43_02025, partial [Flavobacteriales bacterium]